MSDESNPKLGRSGAGAGMVAFACAVPAAFGMYFGFFADTSGAFRTSTQTLAVLAVLGLIATIVRLRWASRSPHAYEQYHRGEIEQH